MRTLVLALALATSVALTAPALADTCYDGDLLVERAELYSAPSTASRSLGSLVPGDPVRICGVVRRWVKVEVDRSYSWTQAVNVRIRTEERAPKDVDRLDLPPILERERPVELCNEAVVVAQRATLWVEEEGLVRRTRTLSQRQPVLVCGVTDGWARVRRDDVAGIMRKVDLFISPYQRRAELGFRARSACMEPLWDGIVTAETDLIRRVDGVARSILRVHKGTHVRVVTHRGAFVWAVVLGLEEGLLHANVVDVGKTMSLRRSPLLGAQCQQTFRKGTIRKKNGVWATVTRAGGGGVELRDGTEVLALQTLASDVQVTYLAEQWWVKSSDVETEPAERPLTYSTRPDSLEWVLYEGSLPAPSEARRWFWSRADVGAAVAGRSEELLVRGTLGIRATEHLAVEAFVGYSPSVEASIGEIGLSVRLHSRALDTEGLGAWTEVGASALFWPSAEPAAAGLGVHVGAGLLAVVAPELALTFGYELSQALPIDESGVLDAERTTSHRILGGFVRGF